MDLLEFISLFSTLLNASGKLRMRVIDDNWTLLSTALEMTETEVIQHGFRRIFCLVLERVLIECLQQWSKDGINKEENYLLKMSLN